MTVFIQKGDTPLSTRQAVKRGLRHFESEKAQWEREQGIVEQSPEYFSWANQWVQDNVVNAENNAFNHSLAAYDEALKRLAQYVLSEGRPEVTEEIEEWNEETGEMITQTVVVQTEISPLELTVEVPVIDEVTGEQTGTEFVVNPEIEKDEMERAAAQQVINSTSEEVKAFYDSIEK